MPSGNESKIARARELAARYPAAREMLDFYVAVLECRTLAELEALARERVPESWRDEFLARAAHYVAPQAGACSHQPCVALLREAGYGAARSLVCCFCLTEWPFARLRCPACGEEGDSSLAVYSAEQFHNVRVDVCLTCKAYIKTIDLTRNALADPIADDLASAALDLWAQEQGYGKIALNLLGL
jgi:FdhE protein